MSENPMNGKKARASSANCGCQRTLGLETRFGPDWPGVRCLAKTRRGTECQKPANKGRVRCQLHGGRSTGPKTPEGRARIAAANFKHGNRTKERLAENRERAAVNRQIWFALRTQIELMIRDGYLPRNYKP
jgi:hypothetical protein